MQSSLPTVWNGHHSAKTLYMAEGQLVSVEGARRIIDILSNRDTVAWLILRHNNLGDDGCTKLFEYLCSVDGQRHKVSGILLHANNLGNPALESIGNFLRDNRWLRELYLAANDFVGDSDVTASFAEALNSSSLKVLSLSSCDSLSDAFAERFFPRLSSPHLVNLQLSSIGLTRTAVPWIVGYLSSPRSRRLATLKLNGNGIGARGAAKIVRTVMDANFNVLALEMHGVQTYQGDQGDGSGEDSAPIDRLQQDLMYALTRNDLLQRQTQAAAVRLLQYSRTLLLDPRRGNEGTGRPQSHIQSLPAELRLHILSLTVNTLSTNQCIRIFQFASDPATLPAILPDLRQRQSEGIPERSLLEKSSAPFTLPARSANRTQWLQAVGCDLYEP